MLEEQLKQTRDASMSRMPQSIIKTFEDSLIEIRADRLKEKALQVGDYIPDTALKSISGNDTSLKEVHTSDLLVLNFYRGGWCPYCNMELRAYEKLKSDFAEQGANIVAISSELTDLATQTSAKNSISYPILTDVNARFMQELGIAFKLNEAVKAEYINFGINLETIHGNQNYELPVPAVYVIDKERKIIFRHFEEDYTTRLEPQTLLEFLQKQTTKV
jgi:peroxiredoxin